jgi:hypothetical protein
VIEIETAQKILVGFAIAGMLGDDHSRDELKHLAWSLRWPALEQLGADRALGRGIARPYRIVVVAANLDGIELCNARTTRSQGDKRDGNEFAGTRNTP